MGNIVLPASRDPNAIQVTESARIAITHGDGSNALTAARTFHEPLVPWVCMDTRTESMSVDDHGAKSTLQ